ncbi:oligogalacturonide ABC transporter membrane protein [Natranaerovirga pectinivora]|uniref:Oligogalacturonide ABC transporter membrane protein n=1 Tax=Natranaerovirga pectinivora TaxID=682400 RepID=A0A4R3MIY1_9FIRM|nr:sugar ABC transporter permease [Natranaerovirga pectinivora]TCT13840.1 oligogalacturonide ABC transporter membrane protein [Natranaerovirga pectinivora]
MNDMSNRRIAPYIFITPWVLGFLIFRVYPFVNSFRLSFMRYRLMSTNNRFIGLDNYVRMLTDDPVFSKSFWATIKYVILTVPLVLVFSLFIAFILNFKLKGVNFFRTAYYIPSILGGNVAIVTLWKFLFETRGLVNQIITNLGGQQVRWYTDPNLAMLVMSLLRSWQFGSTMVIFLAALQNVPRSLYEAGAIDGATKFRMFFAITIPIITPVILFNFVMRTINAFQEFNSSYLITQGRPNYSTYLLNVYIYETAFRRNLNMGYAAALSWVLFLLIMILTMSVFRSSKYWVHYSD